MTGYERLLELARLETELLLDPDRWDELAELDAERQKIVAALPAQAPDEAFPLLLEAAAIVAGNEARLDEALRGVRAELAHHKRGRQALSAYGSTPGDL